MAESKPIFDLAEALRRTMGDVEFLKMMVDELQRTTPDHIERIRAAWEADDLETLGKEAHQFKGAAANLGAKAVAAAALEVEEIGKCGSPEGAQQALENLDRAVMALNQCLDDTDWSAVGAQ